MDGQILFVGVEESSLGFLGVAAGPRGVCALTFGDTGAEALHAISEMFPAAELVDGGASLAPTLRQARQLVETPGASLPVPLDVGGTAFQRRVWEALRGIPVGETRSYSQLAEMIGKPAAVRAVARACGSNRIMVAVPCHRAIAVDGALAGYRFGIARKRALLARETVRLTA